MNDTSRDCLGKVCWPVFQTRDRSWEEWHTRFLALKNRDQISTYNFDYFHIITNLQSANNLWNKDPYPLCAKRRWSSTFRNTNKQCWRHLCESHSLDSARLERCPNGLYSTRYTRCRWCFHWCQLHKLVEHKWCFSNIFAPNHRDRYAGACGIWSFLPLRQTLRRTWTFLVCLFAGSNPRFPFSPGPLLDRSDLKSWSRAPLDPHSHSFWQSILLVGLSVIEENIFILLLIIDFPFYFEGFGDSLKISKGHLIWEKRFVSFIENFA